MTFIKNTVEAPRDSARDVEIFISTSRQLYYFGTAVRYTRLKGSIIFINDLRKLFRIKLA